MKKRVVLILKWILCSLLGLFISLFFLLALDKDANHELLSDIDSTTVRAYKEYTQTIDSAIYFSLLEEYGSNKILPREYELQCLLALSHYPELKETSIEFKVQPAFVPLYSWPEPKSVLFPWIKRRFMVVISTKSADFFEPILFHNLPFNEQVGIIGHELAHTIFYKTKSALATTAIAFQYQFIPEFATSIERDADKIAIAHGFGYQLYDYAFFVRKAFGRSLTEIENEKGNNYLSPGEIAIEMERYDFYQAPLPTPITYFSD